MKKLLLIPALMLSTIVLATEYNYEITPVIGYNVAEGNLHLDNEMMGGLEMKFNDVSSAIKPELSILHSAGVKSENATPSNTTNITRAALNGVYEYGGSGVIPFAKAGIGYEHMNRDITNNSDGAFVDAGAGIKIPFTDALALKLEALYMLKYNDNSAGGNWGDSNLALLAGLNYSFGAKAQPTPIVPAPIVIVDGDDDNDGVLNSIDKCPTTTPGKVVNADGCFVDGDDDKDGVLNSVDKCPTTPAGKTVDAEGCCLPEDDDKDGVVNASDICPNTPMGEAVNVDGCPNKITLHAKFDNNSAVVKAESFDLIQKYADFLNKYPAYSSKIVGHTSNTGEASYNLSLSQKRSKAVEAMLIEKDVPASRLSSHGEGEANPVADNATKEGRAENRRIEAELIRK
ncbi:MAG: OOP family OmpA-OmpF porin [Sulfurimonas sp.]|jgi:OOP family OmpA-OmpF porin|uniref:OmpA family protein n=1 Tax=Sulfurimonas sp. TaxID=2022749 RepID=UPI0039E6B7AA